MRICTIDQDGKRVIRIDVNNEQELAEAVELIYSLPEEDDEVLLDLIARQCNSTEENNSKTE